jgi:hypothetical protein
MFVNRNWDRTESDDFKLNVEKLIQDKNSAAIPQYVDGILVG